MGKKPRRKGASFSGHSARDTPLIFHRENRIDNVPHPGCSTWPACRAELRHEIHIRLPPIRERGTLEKQSKMTSRRVSSPSWRPRSDPYIIATITVQETSAKWVIRVSLRLFLQLGWYNEPLNRPLIFTLPCAVIRFYYFSVYPRLHFQLKRRSDPIFQPRPDFSLFFLTLAIALDDSRCRTATMIRKSFFYGVLERIAIYPIYTLMILSTMHQESLIFETRCTWHWNIRD